MSVALGPQPLEDVGTDLVRWALPGGTARARARRAARAGRLTDRWLADGVAGAVGGLTLALAAPGPALSVTAGLPAVALPLLWLLVVTGSGGYRDRLVETPRDDLRRVLLATTRLLVLAAASAWLLTPSLPRSVGVAAVALTAGVSVAHRVVVVATRARARRSTPTPHRRVLVVGHHDAAADLVHDLGHGPAATVVTVADVCAPDPTLVAQRADSLEVDGVIVLPCHHLTPADTRRLAWRLADTGRHLMLATGLSGVRGDRATITAPTELPLVHVRHTELTSLRRSVVRLTGRVGAAVALVLVSPLLLGLVLAIRWESPGPALYRQTRIGHHRQPFIMLKFRTMHLDADRCRDELATENEGHGVLFKLRRDPRVTRLGRLLRRYSLDELPQLINVVRGDMAWVGPRPPLPEEVAEYTEDMHRRFAVAPGITGLWQVSGRSDLGWEESVRLDLSYVDNWSPMLDAKILARTVTAVCGHRGAY